MKIDDTGELHPRRFCQNSNVSQGVELWVSLVAFSYRSRTLTGGLIADAEAFALLKDPPHSTPPQDFCPVAPLLAGAVGPSRSS